MEEWLQDDAYNECLLRKAQIDQELLDMGADRAYCSQYFQSASGVCEKVVGGRCIQHRAVKAPLPNGKICSLEFASMAADLRRQVHARRETGRRLALMITQAKPTPQNTPGCQVSEIEAERHRLKQEWDMLKTEQTSLEDQCEDADHQVRPEMCERERLSRLTRRQELLQERKTVIRNDMTHTFKTLRDLMGERLQLLECEPVDTTSWHENVARLLSEKITLLERMKLGAAPTKEITSLLGGCDQDSLLDSP
jgi:hypothetical protein